MTRFFIYIFLSIAFLSNAQIDRYPYIQSTATTSTIIAWKTVNAEIGSVAYGLNAGQYTDTLTETTADIRHAISIKNLTPNTRYYYAILSNGNILTAEYFYTAKDSTVQDFSFIQYGDCGYNSAIQDTLGRLMAADDAEFAVVCGDIDQGGVPHISASEGGDNYDEIFFDVYNNGTTNKMLSRECHYTAIGNHDVYADNGATYELEFHLPHNNADSSERYYSFTWGDAKFIALDVITPFDPTTLPINQLPIDQRWWTDFRPGSAQYEFLENELKCNDKKWVFIYFHEGPWTNYWGLDYNIPNALGGDYYQFEGNLMVRQHLVPLFEQYNVDFVLVGHSHLYEKATKNGVMYITSGGAGSVSGNTQQANNPEIILSILENHYVKYNVDSNMVTTRAINQYSQVIDSFATTKTYIDYEVLATIQAPTCYQGNDASIQLNIQGPKAPYTVEWFNGHTGTSINGLSAGTYYAFVRNAYGCEKVSEFIVPETPMDTAQIIDTSGLNVFCEGEALYLEVNNTYANYLWSNGSTNAYAHIASAGVVNVAVENAQGCPVFVAPISITEIQAPQADFAYAKSDSLYNFLHTGLNNVSNYFWDFGDGTTDTSQQALIGHTFFTNGVFPVRLIVQNMCGIDSIQKEVEVNYYLDPTGIKDVYVSNALQIIPNPFYNQTKIKTINLSYPLKAEVVDLSGRNIESFTIEEQNYILNQGEMSAGVYILKIQDAKGKMAINKLVVQ